MIDESGAKTVRLRGAGGIVWEIALPLGEAYVRQLAKGSLRPVDAAAARLLAELGYEIPEQA